MWQPTEAIQHAIKAEKGPVILADVSDNLGGGGSGDTTLLLQELINAKAYGVGFAIIVDPETVGQAVKAGPGAKIKISLGGKKSVNFGPAIECEATVKSLTNGIFYNKGPMQTGLKINLGRAACIKIDDIDVIVIENRVAPNDPEIFQHFGIDPTQKKILVVKSRGHFRAAYGPFAAEILEVDCPGFTSPNLSNFDYNNVRRPIFPLDK